MRVHFSFHFVSLIILNYDKLNKNIMNGFTISIFTYKWLLNTKVFSDLRGIRNFLTGTYTQHVTLNSSDFTSFINTNLQLFCTFSPSIILFFHMADFLPSISNRTFTSISARQTLFLSTSVGGHCGKLWVGNHFLEPLSRKTV